MIMKRRVLTLICIGMFSILLIGKVQYSHNIEMKNMLTEKVVVADTKNIPFEYTEETAINNGDVVIVNSIIHNKHRLDEFMTKINKKKISKIRVVTYTKGQVPLIENLYFNGNNIVLVTDNTRDEVIDREYREIKRYEVSSINYHNKDDGVLYVATLDTGETFDILYYKDIKK
ncbi:DUF4362 domain-containing protein [Clostridium sp.]|uniref:DUF4362 domain-containing protein n=2 Tax=Clostridium sp. TaxID=1506 RepID=UPI002FC673C7